MRARIIHAYCAQTAPEGKTYLKGWKTEASFLALKEVPGEPAELFEVVDQLLSHGFFRLLAVSITQQKVSVRNTALPAQLAILGYMSMKIQTFK